jgi:CheY-like chemotaxis protein
MKREPIKILLAEDNEDDIVLVKEVLEDSDMLKLVRVVRDGEEALAYLRRKGEFIDADQPGLVILDINMPKKNGFEVLDELKSDPKLCQIPVVMLTVTSRDEEVVKAYSKGACSFISKPVDFEEFQTVMAQFALYWTQVALIPKQAK